MNGDKRFLPEIHDLHPGMADRLETLQGAFPADARAHIAYSVVPNWMGAAPLSAHRAFADRVAALPGTLVLHGLTHTKGSDPLNWLLYGHENRSEFQSLSRRETEARLDDGLAIFEQAGLGRPAWFCAPRWCPSPSLDAALAARGFRGVLARRGLKVFDGGTKPVPPLNFDEGCRAWKIAPGRFLRRGTVARLLRAERPFRLVLHPDDLDHPKTWDQIRRVIGRAVGAGWRPVGLADLTGPA